MRNKSNSVWDWGNSSSRITLNKVNLDIAKNLYDTSICYVFKPMTALQYLAIAQV